MPGVMLLLLSIRYNVMKMTLVWFGLLTAVFVLILLMVKSRAKYPREEIDWEAHNLQITEEDGKLRVLTGGQSYLFNMTRQDDFQRLYREAWNKVRLNAEPVIADGERVEFTSAEFLNVRQRIALDWMYVYVANNRHFKFLFWSMSDSETRRSVLRAAEAKYGSQSEKAIALAAHTLNMDTKKFKAWLKRYEERVNRW